MLVLVCVGMTVTGCAFVPTTGITRDKEVTSDGPPAVEQIEDFDPVSLDSGEQPLTKPGKVSETTGDVGGNKLSQSMQGTSEEVSREQGYRIQIFVSSDPGGAQRIMNEAEEFFPQEVYLQYDAPYHKIRVGNCLTRREADLLKEKAVQHGYRDAWIVPSLVTSLRK